MSENENNANKKISLFTSSYKDGELYKNEYGKDFPKTHIYTETEIQKILDWCIERKASDIWIAGDDKIRAKFAGRKRAITFNPISKASMKIIVEAMIKSAGLTALMDGYDVDIKYKTSVNVKDDKGNIFNVVKEYRLNATTIIDRTGKEKTFEISLRTFEKEPPSALRDLGLEREIFDNFYKKTGLNLICGGTGNGKTTLLYGIFRDWGENPNCDFRIVDYAKPIEYRLPGDLHFENVIFRQTEMESMLKPNNIARPTEDEIWRRAGENSLRRAADIINISEARDTAAFRQIMECGITGHLAMTTLHTNTVSSTFQRAIDFFPFEERQFRGIDLVNLLNIVVCQRLVDRADGNGREAIKEYMVFSESVKNKLMQSGSHPSEWAKTINELMDKYSGRGNPHCLCRSMRDHINSFPEGTFTEETIREVIEASSPIEL